MPRRICLNMIVKNEAHTITRCLEAAAPWVDCAFICDTGSTDETQELIRDFFAKRGLPCQIIEGPFVDFSQARNLALDGAEASSLEFDYLLLCDADMELVVKDPSFKEGLTADCYGAIQRTSNLAYYNSRLVKRGCGARYVSVTHEYLSVPGGSKNFQGIEFLDHACGSNRADKLERDERLLLQGLKDEPDNARYRFYLAQTYFEAQRFQESRDLYIERAKMGGFPEECWYSWMTAAKCERALGDEASFISRMFEAYQMRPHRAEPLFHLASYFLSRSMNDLAAMLCDEGMRIPYPESDILFIDSAIYNRGFIELMSIAGFYSPRAGRQVRGFDAVDWLALEKSANPTLRHVAITNTRHYLRSLAHFMPSFKSREIAFASPEGFRSTNPSLALHQGRLLLNVRAVNYEVQFHEAGASYITPAGQPITTRNFLLELDAELSVTSSKELLLPDNLPVAYNTIVGVEDLRLISRGEELWVSGTYSQRTPEGWREMVLAQVLDNGRLEHLRFLEPEGPKQQEKNWMPVQDGGGRFIYSCDPVRVVDDHAATLFEVQPRIYAGNFRGGSQAIPFCDGWLAIVHEVSWVEAQKRRQYYHRWVWFDKDFDIRAVSKPFLLGGSSRFEFCAGLAQVTPETLVLSFGVDDCRAYVATVSAEEVLSNLQFVNALRRGAPPDVAC